MAGDWISDAWEMELRALCHCHTNPAMLKVGRSHIDAGVHVCEWGPTRVRVDIVEMLTGILLLYLCFSGKKIIVLLFLFLFIEILLNTHIKSIV